MKLGAISPDGQTIPQEITESVSPSLEEGEPSAVPSIMVLFYLLEAKAGQDISKKLSNPTFEVVSALERVNEARPNQAKLENLVESSGRCDSPKRIQRKLSRDNIRESSKFKSSLENLRSLRASRSLELETIPQIGEVTQHDTEEADSLPGSRGSSRSTSPVRRISSTDRIRKATSGERLVRSTPTSRKRLTSSEGL
jgi:hypothetical protein